MMKIAVMQPYYFPYIGYFELMSQVDRFVLFDEAQYIRRGWINRNRIRSSANGWHYLTIPVKHAPRKTSVKNIEVINGEWTHLHRRSLIHSYGKKAKDHPLYELLRRCFDCYMFGNRNLVSFLELTLREVAVYLNIYRDHGFFVAASGLARCYGTTPTERIIHYCKVLGADSYLNCSGGAALYNENDFQRAGISLNFMKPTQHANNLSILDLCIGDGVNCVVA